MMLLYCRWANVLLIMDFLVRVIVQLRWGLFASLKHHA